MRYRLMTRTPNLLRLLTGPQSRAGRRSIGQANAAAALVLKHPRSAGQLVRARSRKLLKRLKAEA
jgi:hypothetical protein